jgi:hypothetical protein
VGRADYRLRSTDGYRTSGCYVGALINKTFTVKNVSSNTVAISPSYSPSATPP